MKRFHVQLVKQLRRAQWERAYRSLHPAQRKILTVDRFRACMSLIAKRYFKGFKSQVLDISRESWSIPGTDVRQRSWVVIHVTANTIHAFRVKREFKWIVSRALIENVHNGFCELVIQPVE